MRNTSNEVHLLKMGIYIYIVFLIKFIYLFNLIYLFIITLFNFFQMSGFKQIIKFFLVNKKHF